MAYVHLTQHGKLIDTFVNPKAVVWVLPHPNHPGSIVNTVNGHLEVTESAAAVVQALEEAEFEGGSIADG